MSAFTLPYRDLRVNIRRKLLLVELGQWALATGRGRVVRAVEAALVREGLRDG